MSPRPPHVGTSVLVQAWSGLVAGLLVLGLAAAALHEYTISADDDSLAGLALVVAAALAVPGVLGVVLGGSALALTHRRPHVARALASLSFVVSVALVLGSVLFLVT